MSDRNFFLSATLDIGTDCTGSCKSTYHTTMTARDILNNSWLAIEFINIEIDAKTFFLFFYYRRKERREEGRLRIWWWYGLWLVYYIIIPLLHWRGYTVLPVPDLPTLTILTYGSRFFGLSYDSANLWYFRKVFGSSPSFHCGSIYYRSYQHFRLLKKWLSKRQNFYNKPKIDLKC